MQTNLKRYIFTAISIEIVGALIFFTFFYSLFFGFKETIEFVRWLWLPLVIGCVSAYVFGWILANAFPTHYRFKKWQAVLMMFALLFGAIVVAMAVISLWPNNDIDEVSDVFPAVLVFLAFGGLPTLFVGLWLGSRLARNQF